jgi:hypothetical protein
VRVLLALALAAVLVTAAASVAGWWLQPARRTARALARRLGVRPDAVAVSAERAMGLAISADRAALALVRFPGDPGLLHPLQALRGVELILDGEVRARAFRGEGRRPLDRISTPEGGRVTLRVVVDDPADPAFEVDLWRPGDRPRPGFGPAPATEEARAAFARLEAAALSPRFGSERL